MSIALPGLTRQPVLPVDPTTKALIEKFAALVSEYGNGERQWCAPCLDITYRRVRSAACSRCCFHPSVVRGYMRKISGMCEPQKMCLLCGKRNSLRKLDVDPIVDVLLRDNLNRDGSWRPDPCVRCGAEGTEIHHWAPCAIFDDPDAWPTSPLCPTCHREWHAAMREAKGYSRPKAFIETRPPFLPMTGTVG